MKIIGRPTVELKVILELTEDEAGALGELGGYGSDAFLKAFKEKLGSAYIERHEKGLISLLDQAYQQIPPLISAAQSARKSFGARPSTPPFGQKGR